MSDEAICPYCNAEFEPADHRISGPYECPECSEVMWVEVEYDISFDARCMTGKHAFVHDEHFSKKHGQTVMMCERCGAVELPDMKAKGGEA